MNFVQIVVFVGAALFLCGIGISIVTRDSVDERHYYLCLGLILGGLFVMIGVPIIMAVVGVIL